MAFVSTDITGLASYKSLTWSSFENICALIPTDNSVHFYDVKGNDLTEMTISKSTRATCVSYSPSSNDLAIGWSDGGVSVFRDGRLSDAQALLSSPINLINWHPTAPVFLAASEGGDAVCWDCSTSILPLFKDNADALFTIAVWCPREAPFAFLGDSEGNFYTFENTQKPLNQICSCPKPIHILQILPATHRVCIISGDNYLSQYNLPPTIAKYSQVKLPVGDPPKIIRMRADIICYAISDAIYILNVQNDETQILRTKNGQKVTSIYFSPMTAELYATTQEGSIIKWRSTMKGLISKIGWSAPISTDLGVRIESAIWCPTQLAFIASCTGRRPLIFRQVEFHQFGCKEFSLWQPTPDTVMLPDQSPTKVASTIERIRVSGNYVLVATNSQTDIFTVRNGVLVPFSQMTPNTPLIDIKDETIFDCKGSSLEVRNLQGTVKQTTNLGSAAGAKFLVLNGRYMAVITHDDDVILYDVSRRSPKQQFSTIFTPSEEKYRIRSASISCGGFCVSIAVDYYEDGEWKPSPNLYLHSPQFDKTVTIQFEGRIPVSHDWDSEDTRLLCVQTIPYGKTYESTMTGSLVVPLFIADSLENFRQTPLQLEDNTYLCNVELPRVFHHNMEPGSTVPPKPAILPQFEGLDSADEASKKSLMELNFHLATGDIDAAFNSIRGIDNKGTWRSLAQTCAQMRRIDLADLCFGRMEDGGSALLLHKAKELDEDETASMVVVDSQLGMYDEAKDVTKENRRFDLLVKIHQSLGEWQEAMNVANGGDRIHLKMIAHQNARSLEIREQYTEAITLYEAAGTIQNELPRLAMQANDLKLLFNYVWDRSPAEIPPKIMMWIGRFYEAHKQIDQAIEYYEYAHAYTESVRLLCCLGRWDEAASMVKKSSQRSVMCTYARLLITRIDYYSKVENQSPQIDVEKMKHDVIELFRRSRQFAQAMDFALKYEMIDDILALSFSAPPPLVCRAAQWFEEQHEAKNAILLYSRSGRLNRALSLCFSMKQYDALDEISDSLNSKTDPQVLIRCGRYFEESQRWSKAAQCLAFARQFDDVIELCNKHSIKLNANVIQELSDIQADPKVLKRFAELCEQQGAFQIAATLYVKLKDHLAAMKALIRSGNTSKVIKFANLVKKKETYILAANYMQTQNPRESQGLFDTIVTLYKKAGAPDKLARFYEASAQVEIDEYQEYQKGLDLIRKANDLANGIEFKGKEQMQETLMTKIRWIEMYLDASSNIQKDTKRALSICVELLRAKGIENCLRPDDIYIVMVQCYVAHGNYQNAYKILEDLRKSGTDLTWFMDIEAIQKIYKAVGEEFEGAGAAEDEDYDMVDDDVIDEVQDDEDF